MILLTSTSDLIQIITSAALNIDVHATWVDTLGTVVTPGRTNTAITTAATTNVVASPAASTQRNLKTLHVRNKDATGFNDITVQHTDGSTIVRLTKLTLGPGWALEYTDQGGFALMKDLTLA